MFLGELDFVNSICRVVKYVVYFSYAVVSVFHVMVNICFALCIGCGSTRPGHASHSVDCAVYGPHIANGLHSSSRPHSKNRTQRQCITLHSSFGSRLLTNCQRAKRQVLYDGSNLLSVGQ